MARVPTVVIALVVVAAVAQTAVAAPSFLGFTGLLRTPTADALDRNEFNVAWFAVDLGDTNQTAYAANFGLRDGLEVGALRAKVEHSAHETVLNLKYRIQPENDKHAGFAVGVFDPTDEIQSTVYFVASKTVLHKARVFGDDLTGVRAHLGIGGGELDGVFAGVSAVLANRLLLAAEYDTKDVNLGARLSLGYGIRAHVGWFDELSDFGVGVSYNKMF
jgi:hypothetical protein